MTPRLAIDALSAELMRPGGKYAPRDGKTFCNLFAHDAIKLMGLTLPIEANGKWYTANDQFDWLMDSATRGGSWHAEGRESLVRHDAMLEKPILLAWKNPSGGHGHIAVGYWKAPTPERPEDGVFAVAQAGRACRVAATPEMCFGPLLETYFIFG